MIESGEIFGRAASAGDDDHFDFFSAIEMLETGRDFDRRGLSLNLRGVNQNARRLMATSENVENVAQRCTLRRSDDSDAQWQRGDSLFARTVEEAFRIEAGFQLFERELQSSRALRFHELGGDLQFAAI